MPYSLICFLLPEMVMYKDMRQDFQPSQECLICEKWQKVRKGGQPARARSLIHLNKAVDPSCYYDLMLLSICQNKWGKQPKLEIKD